MPRTKKDEPLREGKVVKTPDEEFENNTDIAYIGDDTDLMPNEGESMAPEIDEEVQEEIDEDKAMFKGNHPLIQAVFEWLDAEIEACDSIEATLGLANIEGLTDTEAIHAMAFVRKIFTAKRVTFQNIHDTVNNESN